MEDPTQGHRITGSPRPVILMVEDDALVRDLVAQELEESGFVIIAVETAEAGLKVLRERSIDLLFTDIRLPGPMNGWRLGEEARALYPNLPVIYTTGFTAEAPQPVPGSLFLRKPYLSSSLLSTIRALFWASKDYGD